MTDTEYRFRNRLLTACHPGVDISIKTGDWLNITDIIKSDYKDIIIMPWESESATTTIPIELWLPVAAVQNVRFNPLEFVATKISRALSYARKKKGLEILHISPKCNIYAGLSEYPTTLKLYVFLEYKKNK